MKQDTPGYWSLLTVAKILLGIFSILVFSIGLIRFKAAPGSGPTKEEKILQTSLPDPTPTFFKEQKPTPPTQSSPQLPIRLRIPTLSIDTDIEKVGLTAQGAMGVPTKPTTTAWYIGGPRPGEVGSAVVAGHYGWVNRVPAVFDELYKIKIGELVFIDDVFGKTSTFIVRELRTFTLQEDATIVFQSPDSAAHLNLVTCKGVWNKKLQAYPNRLVVFTDLLPK